MHFDTSTNGFGVWMQYTPDVSLRAMILDATTMPDIAGPIRPLWSLRWELLFSLLLPVFYWGTLLWRRGVMVKLAVLIAVVYVGTVASASPLVFLPMFAIGALMAQELDRFAGVADRLDRGNGDVKWCALLLAGLTLLTSQWGLMLFSPTPEVGALSQPAGVAGAAILVFVTIFWPRIRVALDRRFVQWLGAVSFSLYLIHEPIAVAFGFLVGEGRGLLAVPLTIVTSLAVASLFRRLIELPSHHIARRIGVAIDGERPRNTGHADADVNNRSSDGGN
jgi:peptidoglycan/LPS O-acetylase OafA/YrhL